MLTIDQRHLAFQPDEIATLFAQNYDLQLSRAEVQQIAAETEGWAIAVQLVWQGLRARQATARVGTPASAGPALLTPDSLFGFLAQEVVNQQPQPVQRLPARHRRAARAVARRLRLPARQR